MYRYVCMCIAGHIEKKFFSVCLQTCIVYHLITLCIISRIWVPREQGRADEDGLRATPLWHHLWCRRHNWSAPRCGCSMRLIFCQRCRSGCRLPCRGFQKNGDAHAREYARSNAATSRGAQQAGGAGVNPPSQCHAGVGSTCTVHREAAAWATRPCARSIHHPKSPLTLVLGRILACTFNSLYDTEIILNKE